MQDTQDTTGAWNRVSSAFHSLDGRSVHVGRNTSCPVPGHGKGRGDKDPSLAITRDDRGVGLHCQVGCPTAAVCAALGLTLADLFNHPADIDASGGSTQVPKLLSPQNITSSAGRAAAGMKDTSEEDEEQEMDRLLSDHAAGRIVVEVDLPPIPPGMPEPHRRVLELFALCVALRRWADVPEPYEVRFSRYWAAKWTGLHDQTVKRAIAALQRPVHPLAGDGLLVFLRETRARRDRNQARGTFVFAPGWLVDAETLARPTPVGVVAGGPELGEEVGEDAAVSEAEAGDGGEVLERDDGLGAAAAGTGGGVSFGHDSDSAAPVGVWDFYQEDDGCPF